MRKGIGFIFVLLIASTAAAQNEITIFQGVGVGKREATAIGPIGSGIDLRLDSTNGPGISFGRFFSPHVAARLESQWLRSEATFYGIDEELADAGHLDLIPVTATVELHSNRDGRFDLFVGGGYAYVFSRDLDEDVLEEIGIPIEIAKESAPVATAGLVWKISPRGHAIFSGRWMPIEVEGELVGETLSLKPRSVLVSVGYRTRF